MDAVSLSLAIVMVGLLIIVHEGGHYLAAKWSKMSVRRFSIGFGPPIAKVTKGGTEFVIGVIPFGGYVQIDGMSPHDGTDPDAPTSYQRRPFHQKFATILAGPAANYVLGFSLWFALLAGFNYESLPPIEVTAVQVGRPAEQAGLQVGDLLVGVRGKAYETEQEFKESIDQSNGGAIPFDVKRGDQSLVVTVTPNEDKLIGIGYTTIGRRPNPLPPGDALAKAWDRTVQWTLSPFKLIAGMIQGVFGIDDMAGPVGIVRTMQRAFKRYWVDALSFAAAISIALGIFNLLPIPSLDGSRLLFLLVGVVRRRPVEPKIESYVHAGGLVLMLGLLAVVSVFDVLR